MKREIKFFPAWDRTNPDPSKNYGVSCLDMKFLIYGNKGIVEFDLDTNWYLPHIMKRRLESFRHDVQLQKEDFLLETWINPCPLDICYYSLIRLSEDDTFFDVGLDWAFDGKPCFYGYKSFEGDYPSPFAKDVVFGLLVEKGDGAVWEYLENYYKEIFGED